MIAGEVSPFYVFTMELLMCVLMMDIVKEKSPSEKGRLKKKRKKREGLDLSTTQDKWVYISGRVH